jgi:hypothetical protein
MTALQPDLIPGPADLMQALRFAIVVTLTCGLGFLASARRVETAFFTGWGIACLVFVMLGCLTQDSLAPAAILLCCAGAAGLVIEVLAKAPANNAIAWRVLAIGAPLLLMLLSLRTTAFDDFSFWAPNLLALCFTGHFPSVAQPLVASFMPGYPRGIALSGYATWLLHPDTSPAGIIRLLATGAWWNILVMLAAAAALANNLAKRLNIDGAGSGRRALWAVAGMALLLQSFLNPGFISKMTLTNMGDGATGSGLAMLTALLFECPGAGQRTRRIIIEMAGTAAAVVFIRQDNLALLGIWALGAALGLLLGPPRLRRIGLLVLAACPAVLVWLIWSHYAAAQIPGGAHRLLPIREWHWSDYPYTLYAAGRVLLSKGVYSLLAIGFGIAFLRMLFRPGRYDDRTRLLLTATTVLIFGNMAFIMFTYLATSFTQVETRTAVTFWRFLAQTAPAEMVALACVIPVPGLNWLKRPQAAPALAFIAALLPVALLPTPYTFRTDLQFPTPVFLGIGQSLAGILPANANLLLLDNSDGSGYVAWMIKFGLAELGGATNKVTLSLAPQLSPHSQGNPNTVAPGSYVLVTQSQWRPAYFPNTDMQPWHAYLFKTTQSGLVLLKDWPIPRYGRKY